MLKKSVVLLTSGALALSAFLPFGGSYAKASANDSAVDINKYVESSSFETKVDTIVLPVQTVEQESITPVVDDLSFTTYGVKSKAVVKVAQLLKAGGDEVIDAAKAFNIIDAATAKTFKNNSKKIGDFLDRFENAGENAANEVRTLLPVWLKENTSMSKGVAENISIAVAWAIRGADFLFF
ncbi:hypothetical protein ABFY60_27875 [Lysinibacillus pakistanensis]|uniref:hypothetical protein n=1 Tax=Lysinibacillus pakistanensis TaxID=759811 RepID=UPI003D2A5C49